MNELEIYKAIAFGNIAQPTYDSFIRWMQRFYSITFNTPLPQAETIPLEKLSLHVYEHLAQEMDQEDLIETYQRILNPNFDEDEDESFKEFAKQAQEEADKANSLKSQAKTPIPNDNNKLQPDNQQSLDKPTQGSKVFDDETPVLDSTGLDDLDKALKE